LIKTAWGGKSLAVDFRPPSAGLPPAEVLQARLDRINENNKKNKRELLTMEQLKSSYGHYYRLMISEVDDTLKNLKAKFPEYDPSQGYEIAGFVWFQGWNDGGDLAFAHEYTENFKHLVHDIRKKYGPIPVVIGTSGFGKNAPSKHDGWVNRLKEHVEPAQIAAAKQLENVECFETGDCLIPHPDRTSNRGIHHWFNSAETYFLIGDGLGRTMKAMLE
jgi:alpha-galactosidase